MEGDIIDLVLSDEEGDEGGAGAAAWDNADITRERDSLRRTGSIVNLADEDAASSGADDSGNETEGASAHSDDGSDDSDAEHAWDEGVGGDDAAVQVGGKDPVGVIDLCDSEDDGGADVDIC